MSRYYPIFILLAGILSFLLPLILYAVTKLLCVFIHKQVAYKPFLFGSFFLLLGMITMLLFGYFVGRWVIKINRVNIVCSDLPLNFDSYRVVHISDLHLKSFNGHIDKLERVVKHIHSLKPDIICITGDLVTFSVEEVNDFKNVLSALSAPDGVYSILGNHDCFPYHYHLSEETRKKMMERLVCVERSLGWQVLNNANRCIHRGTDDIYVVGVMNQSCKMRTISSVRYGNLKLALNGTDGFRILLSHDPSHWETEVVGKEKIELTLSGHTHNAQLSIFGWSPISWFYSFSKGLYRVGGQFLYVNTGIGCTVPFRIGVPEEITLIELHNEQTSNIKNNNTFSN